MFCVQCLGKKGKTGLRTVVVRLTPRLFRRAGIVFTDYSFAAHCSRTHLECHEFQPEKRTFGLTAHAVYLSHPGPPPHPPSAGTTSGQRIQSLSLSSFSFRLDGFWLVLVAFQVVRGPVWREQAVPGRQERGRQAQGDVTDTVVMVCH